MYCFVLILTCYHCLEYVIEIGQGKQIVPYNGDPQHFIIKAVSPKNLRDTYHIIGEFVFTLGLLSC